MYDGLWDKWSHSLLPTPLNPLSPLFAVLDPYWLERKHKEDRPYPVSGPMFTEGTPWGAVLNPTIGAFLKPEREEHYIRFRNGIDIVSLLHNANESIRERARDFTRTHYLSVKGGEISSVSWNAWNAPTPDISVLSLNTTSSGLAQVNTGIYGVYGNGNENEGIGSAGGVAYDAYGASRLGNMLGGTYPQNVAAGFNAFSDEPGLNKHLLAYAEPLTVRDSFAMATSDHGGRFVRHGEIIANEKGELGIYQNRPIYKQKGAHFDIKDKMAISAVTSKITQDDQITLLSVVDKKAPTSIVKGLNEELIRKSKQHVDSPYAIDDTLGSTSKEKLSSYNPSQAMDLINDADAVADLLSQGNGSDFVRNASTSVRLIGGIYGYMGSELVGLGIHNEKRLANSSDMYAFNRNFWDLNLGGAGGAVSEIGRRFIPNFSRLNSVNPLMNTMPSWLLERFRYGDPMSSLPKGEMRLPGPGWLTLNELHPDQYSTPEDPYGSFDRFKILADIAPGSPEYKLWRDIAKRTVTSPELLEEMEQIKQRAREQGKKHDFYPYKIMGTSLDYKTVIVSEVLGQGKFRSGSTIYKMAGITVKGNADENAQEVLSRYLHPGQKITIAYDETTAYAKNKDTQKSINAAVYINGEAVNKQMIEAGDAVERKGDKSAAATVGQLSGMQYLFGLASEVIGHADIPIISDQWLRIRSPYESYLAEQVYGTPYQSWAHPIQTFLMPAIERAIHDRSIADLLLFDAFHYVAEHERTPDIKTSLFGYNINVPSQQIARGPKQLMYAAAILENRATLVGHAVGNLLDAGNARLSIPISTGLNLAVTAAHMIKGGNSLFDMMTLGAYIGKEVARINEVGSVKGKGKYAAAGAAIGGAYRFIHHGLFGDWIPDRQKQKYEMQDYWDRLTYIKYTGLYKEAARRALDEEGVDVERFMKIQEEKEDIRKGALKKLQKIKDSLNEAYGGKTNYLKNYLLKLVNSRISELQPSEQLVEGGKYTQSAIIYKQAAEATIYGLKKGASWSSIVSALPTNDREYFMEFVSETDEDKRNKILAIVSPSLKKALQMSWGMKPDKQQSNEDFFEEHYLPDSDWQGWNPDVDLNDIYVKTVNNEAMNLADFGFYDNALREPAVEEATPLPFKHENDDITLSTELSKLLKGKGLKNVEVSVTSRNSMGPTDIIANIAVWAGLKDQQHKVEDTARAWI